MGNCQNYGPLLGPYFFTGPHTGPNLGDPKRDHNFDNQPYDSSTSEFGGDRVTQIRLLVFPFLAASLTLFGATSKRDGFWVMSGLVCRVCSPNQYELIYET